MVRPTPRSEPAGPDLQNSARKIRQVGGVSWAGDWGLERPSPQMYAHLKAGRDDKVRRSPSWTPRVDRPPLLVDEIGFGGSIVV